VITAALKGVLDRVRVKEPDEKRSGIRPANDGRPPNGYGGYLYYGVYLGSVSGTGQECDERVYTICVDVSINLAKVPDKKRGDAVTQSGGLLDVASDLARYMMRDSACKNSANENRGENPKGIFYENFNSYSISSADRVSDDWFGIDCGTDGCPPSGLKVTLTLSGMKYGELAGELPG
jgi:hypothetical protein